MDLFALEKEDDVLTVNAKWLHHLQVALASFLIAVSYNAQVEV